MAKPNLFNELRAENTVGLDDDQYDRLLQVMHKHHYSDFVSREQGLVTLKYLKGENVFGVLPTCGGKSFTFQMTALLTDGLTVVVSPLIALMKDQTAKLPRGVSLYFNSDLTPAQKREVKRRIRQAKVKLLYVSPERLKSTDFKELLNSSAQRVKRIVIDEAHCVIEWGYAFRVKYLHIAQEIRAFEHKTRERIPILLLTATASPWLQKETVKNLGIVIPPANFIVQKQGAERKELRLRLHKAKDDQEKVRWLARQLKPGGKLHGKRGIIFSAFADGGQVIKSRNAENICGELQERGVRRIGCYHGGMGLDERRAVQRAFQNKRMRVLVATKAFGMGIDLPKLDFIIHFYPPISLEEYWQEAGRGGRGMRCEKGEHCECIVLHKPSDLTLLRGFPNLASFEKILSTYTAAAQGEFYFSTDKVRPKGKLRRVLDQLHKQHDIRRAKGLKIAGVELEHWKLKRPSRVVARHIEAAFKKDKRCKTDQTNRLLNNLRLRTARRGNVIRIDNGMDNVGPTLTYYETEFNWLTEPGIEAMEMLDDKWESRELYSRFRLVKPRLSRKEIRLLAKKVDNRREQGFSKLNYVFDKFLKTKKAKSKDLVLDYLERGEGAV